MLDAELKRLQDYNAAIAEMLDQLEKQLALPLPDEPPFEVLSYAIALHDRVYEMARSVGDMKRQIRDMVLQHTLTADFTQPKQT